MTPRAILGPGDLPMLVRAERVPLSLTRQSIERLVELAVLHLEALDEMTADTRNDARSAEHPEMVALRTGLAADRIATIDALAELRGAR
jgi:hypothetical protein